VLTSSEIRVTKSALFDWATVAASILSAIKRPSVDTAANDRNPPLLPGHPYPKEQSFTRTTARRSLRVECQP
jgi:hypothetical protein